MSDAKEYDITEPKAAVNEYIRVNSVQMHYFLEVARAGSFTNAAKRLYTSQSALSKNILALEQTLGMTLFVRSHKQLSLTDAGRHLYDKWELLLSDLEQSVEECRILQHGYTSMLSIGFVDSHNPEKFALPFIHAFMQQNPNIHINVLCYPVQELRAQLLNGHLDVVYSLLYDVEQLQLEEVDYKTITVCPHNLAMLASNPLCDKEFLEKEDLRDCRVVTISPLYTPTYSGMINDLYAEIGAVPHYVRYTNNSLSLLYNLVDRDDVFICDRYYRGYAVPSFGEIQFRPIAGTRSGVTVNWLKNNPKPELARFLECLEQYDGA